MTMIEDWISHKNNQIVRLLYITQAKNILITGFTGTGKSYLASALDHQACYNGYRVMYHNAQKLFAKLKNAKADDTFTAS